MQKSCFWKLSLAVAAMLPLTVRAADNVVVVVSQAAGLGTKSIGTFGYKPDTDGDGPDTESIWVTGYGSGALQTTNPTILEVTGVSLGQTPTATTMVTEAQSRYFYTDGNPNYTVSGNQGSSSFLFNPLPIGTGPDAIAPYSMAWTIEGVTVNNGVNTTASSDRVDRYSLNQVTSNADALVQLKQLTTVGDLQAAGATAVASWIRQGAWSSDGQSLYQADGGSTSGIFKVSAATGAVQRIVTSDRAKVNDEIAVLKQSPTTDRILMGAGTSDAVNAGGINYVDYSGTVLSADSDVKTFLKGSDVKDFLDGAVAGRTDAPNLWSMTVKVDSADPSQYTIYVEDNGTHTLFAVDQFGRMHKVTTRDELTADGEGGGTSILRLQNRQTLTPQGFTATQVMFTVNSSSTNIGTLGSGSDVVGAFDYKVGDFNRDNVVNNTDKQMFLNALQPRLNYTAATLPAANVATDRFDLNGNRTIDWKDVKILQTYLNFKNGDANLDGAVDQKDLDVVAANYYTISADHNKTWALGDFASLDPNATTYSPLAADANTDNLVDLEVLAQNWTATKLTFADVNALGYTGQLRDDVILTLVPEPTSAGLLFGGAALLLSRRRRKGIAHAAT